MKNAWIQVQCKGLTEKLNSLQAFGSMNANKKKTNLNLQRHFLN